jgi:FtsP/CotA-like multicopper oxidase with cupredoxin domain
VNTATLTRRNFVQAGIALGACAVAPGFFPSARAAAAQHPGEGSYPLAIPPLTDASLPLLACAPALVNMGDGRMRRVLAYNGQFPGPTWVARTGDIVTTRLQNNLGQPTITHWHGLLVDFPNDGGPLLEIEPGESYDYRFPIVQRASLNFYHPHPHMLTG